MHVAKQGDALDRGFVYGLEMVKGVEYVLVKIKPTNKSVQITKN